MKTKTPKAEEVAPEVEISEVSVTTAEPVVESHEMVEEAAQPVAEVAPESAPTVPENGRTVRGIMLKPVRVVYHAGLGTVHLVARGGKAVGTKSVRVVRRKPKAAPVEAVEGNLKATEAEAVTEVAEHA